MSEVIAALQTAWTAAVRLRDLSKKIEDAEFKMALAELLGDLADAKVEAAELKTELAQLREQNLQLSERLNRRDAAKPKLVEGVYQFSDEEGQFCTACFDTKTQKVRVTALSGPFRAMGRWNCPACKAIYD